MVLGRVADHGFRIDKDLWRFFIGPVGLLSAVLAECGLCRFDRRRVVFTSGVEVAAVRLIPYYGEWLNALAVHQSDQTYESLFYAQPLAEWLLPNFRVLQIGSLAVLALLFLVSRRKWDTAAFRAQALGILMGWDGPVQRFVRKTHLHHCIGGLHAVVLEPSGSYPYG